MDKILTLPETLCDAIHRQRRRCASGGKLSESRNTFFTPQQSSSAWSSSSLKYCRHWGSNHCPLAWELGTLPLDQLDIDVFMPEAGKITSKLILMESLKVRQSRNDLFKPTFLPKKWTNKFDFTTMILQVNLFSFVFWRKSTTPKNHFEINWPLSRALAFTCQPVLYSQRL